MLCCPSYSKLTALIIISQDEFFTATFIVEKEKKTLKRFFFLQMLILYDALNAHKKYFIPQIL